eukprot:TRINITY_DN2711_c0_g1_i2.p1 TRINITY_DN2711_c0_g1~~TRINITY_DN2711_c0_g1_i2.p1  ORF type:complete len:208 (-),score=56.53 TRINITY_DN2711_c0_g1_i2:63-686(-)
MIRRPPRSTLSSSSAASDVYKRQEYGVSPIAVMALSRYETELTDLHAEVAALISESKSQSGDVRNATLKTANDRLKEEPEVFEMCDSEASDVNSRRRLQEYTQVAASLRDQLATAMAGADRSELFAETDHNSSDPGVQKLDALRAKSKNNTRELRNALMQLEETEEVSAQTLAELHRQRETTMKIDANVKSSHELSLIHISEPTRPY